MIECLIEYLPIVRDIIVSISSIVVAIATWRGLGTWRKELRGEIRYKLAERVLRLFYEARDHIRYMRSPGGWGGDGSTREPQTEESEETKKLRDQAYTIFERFEPGKGVFSELHSLRYRFEAIFKKEDIEPFIEIQKLLNKLFLAGRSLMNLWPKQARLEKCGNNTTQLDKDIKRAELVFWESGGDKDRIQTELDEIITRIEAICSPIIKGKRG